MAMPVQSEVERELLILLSKAPRGTMHCSEVYKKLAVKYPQLTHAEQYDKYRNSESHWANRIQQARRRCVNEHLISDYRSDRKGEWTITELGREKVKRWGAE
jgi:Mrr N-terminal domain